ncbi:MAG TPA: 30S ribosomal protein S8 [Candidatus Paceibacterota bacterium]|nr:30S ribosomal protein S8 [Candidatus Paceibacterota bacterium]
MVSDRVGDFIIRLQNAARIGTRDVALPYSAHLASIAKKLKELGFVTDVAVKEHDDAKRTLVVSLAYDDAGRPRLRGVKRLSKPGRRLYASHASAHTVKGGTGARIFSTSAGILSDAEARKNRVGGEELFEIW